jgi:hypothetical protein
MDQGFTYDKLVTMLNYLVRNVLLLGGFLATAAIIFYGFQMAISRGDPTAFGKAKNNLIKAAIGAVIIFGVYTIIATVQGAAQTLTQ